MDGYVIIRTELDTKQLEQDLKNAKKELSQFQKEEERLLKEKGKVELQLSAYDEEKAKIKANTDEMMKKAETETQVTNLLNMESIELDELTQKYSKQFTSLDGINNKLKDNQLQQGLINGKIDEANSKLMKAKGYENVKNQLGKISDKTSDVVRKIGRWGLAIFSVRSAYMFIRQLSGTLAQYDTQYGANLEYIRYLLAQAIAPVLQFLVSLAYKLLSYINAIAQAWFGVNLFSNASVKNFNKMAGSAKSIEKSLQNAGFDEMDVLTDTSSAGGGVGGATPSLGIEKVETPKWIDEITALLAGLVGIITAIRLGVKGIKALGIGLMISGIVYAISSLLKYLKDGTWKNFGKIIQGIGVVLIGLGAIIGSIPVAVAGAIVLIVGTITKYWQQIKKFLQDGIDWLFAQVDWVKDNFGIVGEFIYKAIINTLQAILNMFDNLFTSVKKIFDGFITFFKGVFTRNWEQAWEGIKQIFSSVWDFIKNSFSIFGNWVYSILIQPLINMFTGLWHGLVIGATWAWEGIKTVFSTVVDFFRTIFTNAWTAVKNVFSVGGKIFDGIKEGIVTAFKAIVNAIIDGINRVVSIPFNGINNVLNGLRNVNIFGLKPFEWVHTISVPRIPRLAVGGIVNMPRQRNISRRSNDRRTRSGRRNSINR